MSLPAKVIVAEQCAAVHRSAGYTDLITFANYLIEGPDAAAFLRRILPGRIPAKTGRLSLAPIVNEKGGTLGDATVLRLSDERYMLVASGALSRIHLRTLLPFAKDFDVTFKNRTDTWAGFSVAGPNARTIVRAAMSDQTVPEFFGCMECTISDVDCVVLRLSYVGELSYEIHCALEDQLSLHDALLAAARHTQTEMVPFGGRAMNAMRIEKALPRTGDELTIEATPYELGMEWMLDLDRSGPFIGKEALIALRDETPRYRMVSLLLENVEIDPVGGEPVTKSGVLVGYVSSASFCHRVGKTVALGFLHPDVCNAAEAVDVYILGQNKAAEVSLNCVFDPEGTRARS